MRQIIFRGKGFCDDKWVYGDLIHKRHDKGAVMIQDSIGMGTDVDSETIGQFTGINDFNDVGIWEGDILNVVIRYEQEVRYIAQVVWSGFFPSFSLLLQNGTEEVDWVKCGLMEYNIIGNIHDNPEMLKMSNAK